MPIYNKDSQKIWNGEEIPKPTKEHAQKAITNILNTHTRTHHKKNWKFHSMIGEKQRHNCFTASRSILEVQKGYILGRKK